MDSIGETMGNAGLAQEIQEGLAKGVMKEPAWASPAAVADKVAAIKDLGPAGLYSSKRLGRFVMDEWSKTSGKSFGHQAQGCWRLL